MDAAIVRLHCQSLDKRTRAINIVHHTQTIVLDTIDELAKLGNP